LDNIFLNFRDPTEDKWFGKWMEGFSWIKFYSIFIFRFIFIVFSNFDNELFNYAACDYFFSFFFTNANIIWVF